MGRVQVEERLHKSFLLVVLLKEFFGESALLGGQVQYLLVVEPASEFIGQLAGHKAASAAQLAPYADDELAAGCGFLSIRLVVVFHFLPFLYAAF